jgi:hypothetical protein
VRLLCASNQSSYRILYPTPQITCGGIRAHSARLRRGRLGSTVYFGLIPEGSSAISKVKLVSSDIFIGHSIRTVLLRHTRTTSGETAPFPGAKQRAESRVERRQRRHRQHSLIRANRRNTDQKKVPLAAQLIRESNQESDGSGVAV